MVVVYSGDSERPAPNWEGEPTPRGPQVQGASPYDAGPFLPVKDFHRNKLSSGPGLFDALSGRDEPSAPSEPEPESPAAPASEPPAFAQAAEPEPLPFLLPAELARTRPTVRVLRTPMPRPLSTAPGAQAVPVSGSAVKVLAARRPSARPPEPVKSTGVPRGILLGLLGVAACLGVFLVQRARVREEAEQKAPLVAVIEPSRAVPSPAVLPRSSERVADASSASTPSVPPAPSAEPAFVSASSVRTVTLEVVPPDANVFTHGRLRKGPPFTFEIRPGARLVVEIVRTGYVPRRVVLDGSKPELAVGLLRKRTPAVARARGESPAGSRANDAADERGTVVQSGL